MHQALQQRFRLMISNPCSLKSEKVSPSHRSRAAAGAGFVHRLVFSARTWTWDSAVAWH